MKIIKLSIFLAFYILFSGLTAYEANLYGSRILVCGKDIVKYWSTHVDGEKGRAAVHYYVIDLMTKKSYKYEECGLYKCSPEPDRMYGCKLPDK